MSTPAVALEQVTSYAGLMSLASRLLAREVDTALYRQLLGSQAFTQDGRMFLLEARHIEGAEDEAVEELAAEFCHLFIGPQPVCPPYASSHQGEVKLGGRSARRMHEFMDRHGLHVVVGEKDAVLDNDHLSVELALLAHLYLAAVGEKAESITPADAWAAAHELLHEHLLPWADGYLERLESAAVIAPYNVIACLVRSTLKDAADWSRSAFPPAPGENPVHAL